MGHVFDFIANTRDGVFAVDRCQVIVLWNKGATAILGYRTDEVLGKQCYDVLQGRDSEGCVVCRHGCDAFSLAEKSELPATAYVVTRTKRGDDLRLSVTTLVAPSRQRDLSVLVHVFHEMIRSRRVLPFKRELSKALSGPSPGRRSPRSGRSAGEAGRVKLTRREREVLNLLARGISTEVIAQKLCISPHTVRNHVTNLFGKLGVHSRLEAVTFSMRNGLV